MLFLLGGCASGFEKYYNPVPAEKLAQVIPQFAPPPPKPAIYLHSANMQADGKQMAEDGYVFVGESSFYGPANKSNQEPAVEQGKKVGAAVVMFKSQYMDTRSGAVPFMVANSNVVSTVNTSGTVYGSNGNSASNSGTGTISRFIFLVRGHLQVNLEWKTKRCAGQWGACGMDCCEKLQQQTS